MMFLFIKYIICLSAMIACSGSFCKQNKPLRTIQETFPKQSNEYYEYWQNQKKYLVPLKDFYGQLPEELQVWVAMLTHKDDFLKVGLYKTSNFIFYGLPGTGKTYMGSVFAQMIDAEFMYVQGNELIDQWQGAGFRKPTELFEKARTRRDETKKPVVMFIDELDTIVGSRNIMMHEGSLQLIGSLLKEIGSELNNNIFVIAATNRIETIDPALLRSGRFECHIQFCLPDQEQRTQFLQFLVKPYQDIFSQDIPWNLVAYFTQQYSQADLKRLIDTLKQDYVLKKIKTMNKTYVCQIGYEDVIQRLPQTLQYLQEQKKLQELKASEQNSDQKIISLSWYAYIKKIVFGD